MIYCCLMERIERLPDEPFCPLGLSITLSHPHLTPSGFHRFGQVGGPGVLLPESFGGEGPALSPQVRACTRAHSLDG